jgi:hypothetical protein
MFTDSSFIQANAGIVLRNKDSLLASYGRGLSNSRMPDIVAPSFHFLGTGRNVHHLVCRVALNSVLLCCHKGIFEYYYFTVIKMCRFIVRNIKNMFTHWYQIRCYEKRKCTASHLLYKNILIETRYEFGFQNDNRSLQQSHLINFNVFGAFTTTSCKKMPISFTISVCPFQSACNTWITANGG